MTQPYTPLRYPGGKAKMGAFLAAVMKTNGLIESVYAEPYAGGAGAALHLLVRGYAKRLLLNDVDRAVVAFWRAVLNHTDLFARKIERVPLTVAEWDRQKTIYRSESRGFDLGFACFYLNRTNRSGIMKGGIIGGRSQEGPWLIDARFNRRALADRVLAIGRHRRHISVSSDDALDFLNAFNAEQFPRSFCYLDPPYYAKGKKLYTNYYKPDDHGEIAARVKRMKKPWLMTYDDCKQIRQLYRSSRILESELSYSAREVRRGREIVVLGPGLKVPTEAPRRSRRENNPGFELV
jgi:DNA adenine methylase